MTKKEPNGRILKSIAVFSFVGFVLFYILAAMIYPGGSDFDHHSSHFSIRDNYWCELLAKYTKNGVSNSARPYALMALGFMDLALASFWILFGISPGEKRQSDPLLITTGLISTLFSNFVNTGHHDQFIGLSLGFGCFSISRLLLNNVKHHPGLLISGYMSLGLILLNCIIYYFHIGMFYLPLIQKFTFIFVMLWFLMNLKMQRE